jgi:hypothetical protein
VGNLEEHLYVTIEFSRETKLPANQGVRRIPRHIIFLIFSKQVTVINTEFHTWKVI